MNKTPVIILNGFLGAGKTTLLRNLIVQSHESSHSVAVIVNDMSQLDVDGVLISNTDIVGRKQHNFVTLAGDSLSSANGLKTMDDAICHLLSHQKPDLILIETSGSSHPLPLVKYFSQQKNTRLTGVMVLVDAIKLAQDYDNGRKLIPELRENLFSGKRTVTNLLAEQAMFSTHMILTKTERLREETVETLAHSIHPLNPYIPVTAVSRGNLKLQELIDLPEYDFFRVAKLVEELETEVECDSIGQDPYLISTVVIEDDRPLHPQRLWDTYHQFLGDQIHRSKGFFWLPTRDKLVLLWNQAASSIGLEYLSYWRSGVLEDSDNKLTDQEKTALGIKLAKEPGRFGDRCCRITVIGEKSQLKDFSDALKCCFLTDDEITDWQAGKTFTDPWPTHVVKHKG